MLSVEDGKHSLVEMTEELLQGPFQVDLSQVVVLLEVLEEIDENIGISLVDDSVRLLEELVELQLGRSQQVGKVF